MSSAHAATPPASSRAGYEVVAMSIPIVYTKDGDHDPDGLVYALRAHEPLLAWVRAQWRRDDDRLPRLHERRQRLQLIVDALPRLDQMLARLRDGSPAERAYLAELAGREALADRRPSSQVAGAPVADAPVADAQGVGVAVGAAPEPDAADEDDPHGRSPATPHLRAVRQNVEATLAELAAGYAALGQARPPVILADLATRAQWLAAKDAELHQVDLAIEAWFRDLEDSDATGVSPLERDLTALAQESGLAPARVRRLLLNDHRARPGPGRPRPGDYDRFNPMRPVPVVRPLVLRARAGEPVRIEVENAIRGRRIGFHVQGGGLSTTQGHGVRFADGAFVGRNPDTTIPYGQRRTFVHAAGHEGVWCLNDPGDVRGSERGTNVHGLFGALIVEPPGATWRDPETGEDATFAPWGDGENLDVLVPGGDHGEPFVDFYHDGRQAHPDGRATSFREFTVFLHDEPEIHSGLHAGGEHTVMPLNYRAEPMPNRLPHAMRRLVQGTAPHPADDQVGVDLQAFGSELGAELEEVFWTARTPDGRFLERIAGEEQHHSSWLFGDPVTPILRAYRGDPARIRLVHAGVKETHVFHLHVHQWRAVPQDTARPSAWRPDEPRGSQLLDSITIGPQAATTIDPLYGSGSRQHAVGDIIWHCHLYPHFHHGMWGLWRSFDHYVDGHSPYPDGTPCPALQPLPGRDPRDRDDDTAGTDGTAGTDDERAPAVADRPGFPWFIDAAHPQKSPPPVAIRPDDLCGRRQLLGLPAHSATEYAAMAPGCRTRPRPGACFVDLDAQAARWNREAGLPPPRILSYEVRVDADPVEYNSHGWHDARGHHYTLVGVAESRTDEDGNVLDTTVHPVTPPVAPEPFFPRANHGDIVELTFSNDLGGYPADEYDVAQLPVECGLHVHLVKFDPLAADGSATGWNYLSGASCRAAVGDDVTGRPARTVSRHRWVVDEEFGPCFFHDHLLANYRQKHGLFAALIAQPHGSQWLTPDQNSIAWAGAEAVIVPPDDSGLPPHREACLAVGDFVPLLDRHGRALNRPGELGGDDDPGSMAVNYRSAPLTFRGRDPSQWFTGADPDTPIVTTYPGERLRVRLIQGSHEEQHSFSAHGLRWPKEWHNAAAPLVNQQTIGISEAFTLDIDPAARSPYGVGDHLWQFGSLDDLWVGCWGLVRVAVPGAAALAARPRVPEPEAASPTRPDGRACPPRPRPVHGTGSARPLADVDWSAPVREFVVTARRIEHRYDGDRFTDPWGLIYEIAAGWEAETDDEGRPTGGLRATDVTRSSDPLVLRARRGEWVRVLLINEILSAEPDPALLPFGVETAPVRLPLERLDDRGIPAGRTVSPRVSLHPSLLGYDVVSDDGAYVGGNHDGTAAPPRTDDLPEHAHGGAGGAGSVVARRHAGLGHRDVNWREYWWYADEDLAPASHAEGPGQVCYLQDMADVRNHRHHGLVGALVVEPGDVTAHDPASGAERWWGTSAELHAQGRLVAQELVVLVQDGLRLYVGGNPDLPVPDVVPFDDPEDAGQKGMNYRGAPGRPELGLAGLTAGPVLACRRGTPLWLRIVGACDKPRNHSLTLHGFAWSCAPWVSQGPCVASLSGITTGWAQDLVLQPGQDGDHALRSGAFRWGTEQGLCAIVRVGER